MKNKNKKSKENSEEDFYFNDAGLIVFKASFHLKRGYCCKNGCKHCPYLE